MSAKTRMADIRKAKDARAKKMAIGGLVLLAAVLAFEMPKVLKHGGSSASTPPAATTPTTPVAGPSAPPQTTAPGVVATALAPTTGSTKLPDSDAAPRRSKSQLFSFSRFTGKDPFVQQVVDLSQGLPDANQTAAVSHPAASNGGGATSSTSAPQVSPVRTLAANGAVRIQVNGRVETVRVGASFPSADPLFRLVSAGHGAVKIGIASGSYASGAQTVSLAPGKSLTLVDTADGIRYRIRLLTTA